MSQTISDLNGDAREEGWEPDTVAVVHDLRAPLGVIAGYADLLGSGDLGALPEPARRAVAALAGKAVEMRALLDGLLDTSRPDAAVVAARDVRALDLRDVAEAAAERANPRASLAGCRVELDLDGPTPVRANPRYVERILDNLVNNAITHGRGGRVVLEVRRNGGYGAVSVRDDGGGMSSAARESVFRPFSGGAAPTPAGGLGLYICRTLADRIGGELRCEQPDGGGTAFVLELPLAV